MKKVGIKLKLKGRGSEKKEGRGGGRSGGKEVRGGEG